MSLQVWLPLTDSPVNMIPGLASFSKEGSITVTADSDGWYKVQDSSHTSSRWGAYYDFKVKSNTTYTLKVYSKSTTGITADIGIQSFSGSPGWSVQRDTNNTSTEKYTEYTWVTGATDYNARIYLAMRPSTTVANNYVFYKQPEVWETPKVKNQGVNQVEITNNGATYSASGKIGKCYSISSGNGLTLPASTMTSFTDECSIAFWIKINSWKSSYATFFQAGLNSTPWAHYRFGILRNNTNSTLCFTITNSSGNSSSASYTTSSLNTGVWYHLVFTYTTGKVRCYRNGVLDKEYTTTIVPDFAGITNISIGRGTNGSSYPTDCNLNDFRIYDHCLSPMRVKQISQGLVLHYLLEDKWCETTTNLASVATGGWNNSGACIRLSNDTSLDSTKPTYGPVTSVKITTTGNCALICGTTSASHPSKTLTFSIWCYLSGPQEGNVIYIRSTKTDGNVGNFEYNGSTDPRNWPLNKWIRLEKTITTASDATTFYFCTYANILDRYIALNGWQIEEKSHANPWTPPGTTRVASAIEYDCSGFCNNGTRTGTFTWSSDTPKYNVSTNFNGSNYIGLIPPDSEIQTIAFWVKWSSIPSTQTIGFIDEGSGLAFGLSYGNIIVSCQVAGAASCYNASVLSANNWYHIVVIKTGATTRKLYINAVEQTANSTTNYWSYINNELQIGKRKNTGEGITGCMSDFRAYATALSASDILELYKMGHVN